MRVFSLAVSTVVKTQWNITLTCLIALCKYCSLNRRYKFLTATQQNGSQPLQLRSKQKAIFKNMETAVIKCDLTEDFMVHFWTSKSVSSVFTSDNFWIHDLSHRNRLLQLTPNTQIPPAAHRWHKCWSTHICIFGCHWVDVFETILLSSFD